MDMTIGVVKEIKNNEFRVGLTPDAVSAFVQAGHPVLVEKGAGLGSGFPDEEYVQAGATLEDTAEAVWNKSGMIVKVKEPIECEYRFFRKDLILYTYLHLAADAPLTKALMESGVKAIAYETIVGRSGGLPCLTPMSEIAGRMSVQEGAKYLEKTFGGRGVLLAGIGVNVSFAPPDNALRADAALRAASLDRHPVPGRPAPLAEELWQRLVKHVHSAYNNGHSLSEQWKTRAEQLLLWRGRDVELIDGGRSVRGRLEGLTPAGGLRLLRNGRCEEWLSGSLRLSERLS